MRATRKKILIGITIGIAGLAAIYCGIAAFFFFHFFPNTVLNGVTISAKTWERAEEKLQNEMNRYELTLVERKDVKEKIDGSQIALEFVFDATIQDKIEEQNGFLWPAHIFKESVYELDDVLFYDEQKLKDAVDGLECMNESKVVKPENAYISDYQGGYKIEPAEYGTQIDRTRFSVSLEDALINLKDKLDLEKEGCYVSPKHTEDSEILKRALDKMNTYTSAEITYNFGNHQEVADGQIISTFIRINDKFKVSLSHDAMLDFAKTLSSKYNTIFSSRMFQTSYGKKIKLSEGDYGWWMNQEGEVQALEDNIKAGSTVTREPVYLQRAASHEGNDYGSTYIEINITAQHLFYYRDGKKILETDFVSGNPNRGNATPSGAYGITYKERNATLDGENYETPVKYWMPFNGNVGMHDADWRDEFGGDLYEKEGSHGCVNLPPLIAKKIFSMLEKGDPVIVYELEGTESEETTKL